MAEDLFQNERIGKLEAWAERLGYKLIRFNNEIDYNEHIMMENDDLIVGITLLGFTIKNDRMFDALLMNDMPFTIKPRRCPFCDSKPFLVITYETHAFIDDKVDPRDVGVWGALSQIKCGMSRSSMYTLYDGFDSTIPYDIERCPARWMSIPFQNIDSEEDERKGDIEAILARRKRLVNDTIRLWNGDARLVENSMRLRVEDKA